MSKIPKIPYTPEVAVAVLLVQDVGQLDQVQLPLEATRARVIVALSEGADGVEAKVVKNNYTASSDVAVYDRR